MPFTLLLIGHLSYAWFHLIKPSSNGPWLHEEKGDKVDCGDFTHVSNQLSQSAWLPRTIQHKVIYDQFSNLTHMQDTIRVIVFHTRITPWLNTSASPTEGFYSVTSSAWLPHISSLLTLLVHAERRKSSNKMPNLPYLIAGTLTFSSSYPMVFFICQTNVRNTIPQAQSLWHHSQLLLPPPCLPSLCAGLWRLELQARHLQYHSCQSNGDIGENSHSSEWRVRVW